MLYVVLTAFAVLLGIALALRGWLNTGGIVSIGASIGGLVLNLFKESAVEQARKVLAFAHEYHLRAYTVCVLGGLLGGLGLTLGFGALGIFALSLSKLRRANNVDALAIASRRATYYLVHGMLAYLRDYSPAAQQAKAEWQKKLVTFSRLSARLLEKAVREGRLTEQRFRELVEQAGSMLLTLVFENEPILQHFRLALFRKNDGQLVHFVVVNKGDWSAHRVGDPLVFDKSILGKAMVDCTPIVYPRDKKKPFQKRNVKRFKSFVAVPVPCRTGTNAWGGLCIDHTGDDVVFTKDRVSAVADFGQFVDTLYSMIQKGA